MKVERVRSQSLFPGASLLLQPWVYAAAVAVGALLIGFILSRDVSPLLLLTGVVGLGVVALAFYRPDYTAAALLIIHWANLHDVLIQYHGMPSLVKPTVVVMTLVLLMQRFLSERPRSLVYDSVIWWMLAYVVVAMTGLWFARDLHLVSKQVEDTIKDMIIAGLIFNLLSTRVAFERAVWGMLVVGGILGGLTVYQEVTRTYDNNYGGLAQIAMGQISNELADRARAAGTISDPNYYGQMLLVLVPMGVWGAFNGRSWLGKTVGLTSLMLMLMGIGLTFSRGSYLGAIVVLGVYAIYLRLDARYLLVLPLIAILLSIAPPEFQARFGTLNEILPGNNTTGTYSDGSIQGRSVKANVAFNMLADHPLLGVGRGNYRTHYQDYIRELGGVNVDTQRDAHNLYLEVAAEQGFIGLSVFLGLMLTVGSRLWSAWRRFASRGERRMADLAVALQVGFLGYLATSVFLHGAYIYMLWLQVGMAIAVATISRHPAEPYEAAAAA